MFDITIILCFEKHLTEIVCLFSSETTPLASSDDEASAPGLTAALSRLKWLPCWVEAVSITPVRGYHNQYVYEHMSNTNEFWVGGDLSIFWREQRKTIICKA